MVKKSKRTRKFESSGGVKGRLQKGTITNKGKIKRKGNKHTKSDGENANKRKPKDDSYSQEVKQKREDADFLSKSNLGDLDMDSFFSTFSDKIDEPEDMEESKGQEDSESEGEDVDDDDEEDDDVEEEEEEEVEQEDVEDEEERNSDDSDKSDNDIEAEAVPKRKEPKMTKQARHNGESDSDSDSEEEDVEEAERKMKAEMSKLKKKDPEFHAFLQENEGSLLEYADQSEEEEANEDEEMEDLQEADNHNTEKSENAGKNVDSTVLTSELLKRMEDGAFRMHGITALRKFANAFKSACHLADAEDDQESNRGRMYRFDSSDVFDRLMVLTLSRMHEEFHYHLLGKGSTAKNKAQQKKGAKEEVDDEDNMDEMVVTPNEPINPKMMEKSVRWNDIKPIIFTFLKAATHILSEAKEPDLVVFVLKSLSDYVPYMTPFPRLAEAMLKTLTTLWSAPIDSSEDYQVVRLHAFLRIRQLAMTQPFPFIEECLKKLYLAYAQRAKFATASSVTSALPTLTFMGNCVVELYSLDYHSSYQHAFIYIRQLALHLRTAMQKKTSEAMGAVYCWQYLHCLKLWVAVLTEACQSSGGLGATGEEQLLQSLLFPLSQVILGTVRLMPSTRYLPLRLHCVRLLQQLAAAADVFLPTTSILLEVFDLKELSQPPKKVNKSNVQPLALTLRLRADDPLRTMEELEMCVSEVFVLLNREVDLYQYSAGFPEFAVRICQRLRKVCWNGIVAMTLGGIDHYLTTFFFFPISSQRKVDRHDGEHMRRAVSSCVIATRIGRWRSEPN